jgi:hypothetical protein
MTALALDVRELSSDELDAVTGGTRLIAAARWIGNAIASGMAFEAARAAWESRERLAELARDKDEQDPYSLAKIG